MYHVNEEMVKNIIGITMGDPAGIGPEIVVKALSKPEICRVCRPIVIGDLRLLKRTVSQLNLDVELRAIENSKKELGESGIFDVIDLKNIDLTKLRIGEVSKEAGKASLEYIEAAVKSALGGKLNAITTAPINKESIRIAGSVHMGHTEILGALTNTTAPVTMFCVQDTFIFFLTRHIPLKKAVEAIKKDRIVTSSTNIYNHLNKIGFKDPRIAIAALNPHAGDGGLIGDEEINEVIPAIEEINRKGINATGPIPADAVFHQAFSGNYDAVLSLYHDQGHIPAKTFDFYGTVSVTLGLPFIRTSVDHGTAFEIAGKNIANSKSLEKAIIVATEMASRLRKNTIDRK